MRPPRPDFLLVGAPKAGTTAVHAALAQHPDIFTTTPKEPKYWLCGDQPPPHHTGPGDRHSQQEWVWRRREYEGLFVPARPHQVRGESTPFYLWSADARRRIATQLPDVRLVAVVRDPVDRAYSNWMHAWSDGLEPVADFEEAMGLQAERAERGWAPFWRYTEMGLYGEQLTALHRLVDPDRVLVLRYRDLVEEPQATLDRTCRFLGVRPGVVGAIPTDNARGYVRPGWRPRVLGPVIRRAADAAQFVPPHWWRRASGPLVSRLTGPDQGHRPPLSPEVRARLLPLFADDVALLEQVTGDDYSDWLAETSRGSFQERAGTRRTA